MKKATGIRTLVTAVMLILPAAAASAGSVGGAIALRDTGSVGVLSPPGPFALSAEEVDPFYLKLFEEGKSLWFRGLTAKAIENMEIAYFGFLKNPDLLLEACIYLMICHYEIKNAERAAFFEAKVAELATRERLAGLKLPPRVVDQYQEVSAYFGRLRAAAKPGSSPGETRSVPPRIKGGQAGQASLPANPYSEIAALERRIRAESRDVEAYLRLASLYAETNNPKKARAVLRKLLEIDPENSAARFELGRAHMALRKYRDALAEFEKAAAALDGDIEFHYQRGIAEFEMKNYAGAQKDFERVNALSAGYKLTEKYLEEIGRLNPEPKKSAPKSSGDPSPRQDIPSTAGASGH